MFNIIVKSISDLFFIIILLALSMGLGKKIWSLWFDNSNTPVDIIEEGIFCISLGLGVLGLLILIIGLLGFLSFWIVLSIFVLGFLYSFKEIKTFCLNVYRNKNKFCLSSKFFSRSFLIFSPFLLFAVIWLFLMSRVPPVFYDALVYHLGVPNQYIIRHAIRFFPHAFHSHHPFLIQNIFLICLLLGGYGTAKLLVFVFALLNALSLSLFAVRFYNRPLSWLAGLIFLLTPTILITGSLINVDLGFSLYALLALYSLCRLAQKKETLMPHSDVNINIPHSDVNDININEDLSSHPRHMPNSPEQRGMKIQDKRFTEEIHLSLRSTKGDENSKWGFLNERKWLIISAAMAGLSLGAKYTAIIFCFGLCLLCLMVILLRDRKDFRYLTKAVMIYVFIALLLGSGWYIKNYFWTQNPVYPKWADVWGNPKISRKNLDASDASSHAYDSSNPARSGILSIPTDLVFHPDWFGVGGNIGPLFLFLLPLALIGDRKNRLFPFLMLYCTLYFIAWAFTFRMARFALPLFAVLILLATDTLDRICRSKWNWARYLIFMVLIAGFLYNIYYSVSLFSHVYDPWKYLTGKETEYSYLSRNIPSYPVFEYINKNLPSDSTVLFLGETVNFYCLRQVIASTAFDINPIVPIIKKAETRDDVCKGLKQMGVTHLLINFYGMERLERSYKTYQFGEKDIKLIGDFLRTSHILFRKSNIVLLKI